MQPLAAIGEDRKIAAVFSIIKGEADTNCSASKEAYEKAKTHYLVRDPGKESEATVKFEKAFLYRLAGTLSPRFREAAHKLIEETAPHEKMKTQLFEMLGSYIGFKTRVTF